MRGGRNIQRGVGDKSEPLTTRSFAHHLSSSGNELRAPLQEKAHHRLSGAGHAGLHPQIGDKFVQNRQTDAIGFGVEKFQLLGEGAEQNGQNWVRQFG